jgi:LDH2 family malate/lactate/ureidoglycolate dehydrogenase
MICAARGYCPVSMRSACRAMLNGAAFGRDVIDFNADEESATNTGHCIVAVDIARFVRKGSRNSPTLRQPAVTHSLPNLAIVI